MTSPFGAGRIEVKPPERGIFPLDHDAECKPFVKEFLECLKNNKNDHFYCRESSKAYLQCRMERLVPASGLTPGNAVSIHVCAIIYTLV
jgi:hypothetical protein